MIKSQNVVVHSPLIRLSEKVLFLNDGILGKEIQLCRAGKFVVDQEEVEITKADLESMIKNFNEKSRGVDIAMDFSHESEGKAAGWFTNLQLLNENELWGSIDWTECGSHAVKSREFRYVSVDFNFNYQDNETKVNYGPTLLGAGLTNRPVVKKMVPIILSENNNSKKEIEMKTVAELEKELSETKASLALSEKTAAESKKVAEDLKLSEEKAKAELKAAEEKAKADLVLSEKAKATEEKKKKFDLKLSEGVVCEAQREDFMNDNMQGFMDKAVPFQTSTKGNEESGTKKETCTAQEKVMELAEKKVKEEKISLRDGIRKVLSENKELSEKYTKETSI